MQPFNSQSRFLAISLLLLLLLPACGKLEVGIEQTPPPFITPAATATATVTDTTTNSITASPQPITPVASAAPATLIAQPTPTNIAREPGLVYANPQFQITLTYPGNWQLDPEHSGRGHKFAAEDGFFITDVVPGDNINTLAGMATDQGLLQFGSRPTIEIAHIQGQPARFIWPSSDAADDLAALIIRFPTPVAIDQDSYDFFLLYADIDHMRALAQTVRFTDAVATVSTANSTWFSAGDLQDTLIPFLTHPHSDSPQFGDIATMHADGSGVTRLTTYGYNADPVLSPDGQRIAFRSVPRSALSLPDAGPQLHSRQYNISMITLDGALARQFTHSAEIRSVPVWSPDSRRLAFSQGAEGRLIEIDVQTGYARDLAAGAYSPRYQPAGDGIAFITTAGGLTWITLDGLQQQLISESQLPDNAVIYDFDWLPDNRGLLFTIRQDDIERSAPPQFTLFIASLDGSEPVRLAEDVRQIKLSPDGLTLAALRGSGWSDSCFVDAQLSFMQLSPDFTTAAPSDLDSFTGFPRITAQQIFYPLANLTWISNQYAFGEFELTCTTDRASAGSYLIDPAHHRMIQIKAAQDN